MRTRGGRVAPLASRKMASSFPFRPANPYVVRARRAGAADRRCACGQPQGRASSPAPTRAATEKLAASLGAKGRRVLPYHAGLAPEVRAGNQAAFIASEDMVMVATVAFGMGMDKARRALCIRHAGLPKIESRAIIRKAAARGEMAARRWRPCSGAREFVRARQRSAEVETGPAARRARAHLGTRRAESKREGAGVRCCSAISVKIPPRRAAIATIALLPPPASTPPQPRKSCSPPCIAPGKASA